MRINPFAFTSPTPLTKTLTLTDRAQPGAVLELTFCASPTWDMDVKVASRAQEFKELYVTGRNGGPPAPIAGFDGTPDTFLCQVIAALMQFQEGEEPYSFDEWAKLSETMPGAFLGAVNAADAFMQEVKGDAKKD